MFSKKPCVTQVGPFTYQTSHNWRDGIKRLGLHLSTFGFLGFVGTYYGGWGCAATLLIWRVYEEYLDYKEHRDTLGKALIDLASQVGPAVGSALLNQF